MFPSPLSCNKHYIIFVLFHHNAKPSQNGQLHFQTFQFSYLFIILHKPLFKSIHQCLKIHFVTTQGQIHYNITFGLRYKFERRLCMIMYDTFG